MEIGILVGLVILGLIGREVWHHESRHFRQLQLLRRRYGLSWREAESFRNWLLLQAANDLDRMFTQDDRPMFPDEYCTRWVDERVLNR